MLVDVGGRECIRDDFIGLCRAAGFRTSTITRLAALNVFCLIETAPAAG
ncbi:hypothetical protein [Streptomyces axinellae]|uniref:Uncharacterized protein n=1 Tax=Streptomyces axinellae TaxID=552788 RepID=A0ABN3QYX7_9ACTN